MKIQKNILWVVIVLLILISTFIVIKKSSRDIINNDILSFKIAINNMLINRTTYVEIDFLSNRLTYYLKLNILEEEENHEEINESEETSMIVLTDEEVKKIKKLVSNIENFEDRIPPLGDSIVTLWINNNKKITLGYTDAGDKALSDLIYKVVEYLPKEIKSLI